MNSQNLASLFQIYTIGVLVYLIRYHLIIQNTEKLNICAKKSTKIYRKGSHLRTKKIRSYPKKIQNVISRNNFMNEKLDDGQSTHLDPSQLDPSQIESLSTESSLSDLNEEIIKPNDVLLSPVEKSSQTTTPKLPDPVYEIPKRTNFKMRNFGRFERKNKKTLGPVTSARIRPVFRQGNIAYKNGGLYIIEECADENIEPLF